MKDKFQWGVATAAYQIEGAAFEDGRGPSIWDEFSHNGKCYNNHNGDIACDHYHKFREDIELMAKLGVDVYRFSVSWPRILPDGTGKVNQKGIDFYNGLIDCLIEHGITPYITLFHWDLPLALERKGAWANPESSDWFLNYARIVFENFSDRVKHFITFNEPQCIISSGYRVGDLAPGLKLPNSTLVVMAHNILLSHGKAVRALRETAPDCKIGFAPNSDAAIPFSDSDEDISAAKKAFFDIDDNQCVWTVSWWSDPIFFGKYPENKANFQKYLPVGWEKDMEIISTPIDFYCQNIYKGFVYKSDKKGGYERLPISVQTPRNSMNWPVTPECLYWGPKFLYERYKTPVFISENGMPCHDTVSLDGKVHDPNRIDFIERYLKNLEKCRNDGADIRGYFYWSFMDNFEWANGYTPRFGLVYINYETLQRIPKDSFYYYKGLMKKYFKD